MKCSFCGKDQEEVHKLIVASEKLAICDECVFSCLDSLVYQDNIPIDLTEEDDNEITNSGC